MKTANNKKAEHQVGFFFKLILQQVLNNFKNL